MFVSKLRLRNWKNIQKAECKFGYRVFLIGPNASGKSNVLDSLRFLRELSVDGLSKSVEARDGISMLRCLSARGYSSIDVEVEITDELAQELWSYKLILNQDRASRPVVREERVTVNGRQVLKRPNEGDESDPFRLTYTALEQAVANKEFRVVSEFFRSVSYQHLLPQVVKDPKGFSAVPVKDDPYGRDFLLRMWQTPEKTRVSRLSKINDALKIAMPQLHALGVNMDDATGTPHLIGGYAHWRPTIAKQYEKQFSDGTLRLLGLLWSVFEGDGPLLLEEPEISLHADVVRYLPAVFERIQLARKRRRQVLISTHSAELLSSKSIGPDEVLILVPSPEGTSIVAPDSADKRKLREGLSAGEVLLPKAAPKNVNQLELAF